MNALAACHRAYDAWCESQPQLFMELYPDDGLDGGQPGTLLSVEPAVVPRRDQGGLNPGAEPCRDTVELTAETAPRSPGSLAAPPALSSGSAPPINQTAPGRTSPEDVRDLGQEVTSYS